MLAITSRGWLTRTLRHPGFWLLFVLVVLITFPHYREQFAHPAFLSDWLSEFGVSRHTFERIGYLVPIIWSVFLFGRHAAFAVSLLALACMLPRALFMSHAPMEAFFEAVAVFIMGNIVAISFDSLKKERERRARLETAESTLRSQIDLIKENEKRLAALNRTSTILSQSLQLEEVLDKATENVMEVMEVKAALVYLVPQAGTNLVLAAHRGVPNTFAERAKVIQMGTRFNGRVAQTGEPLYVENASTSTSNALHTAEDFDVGSLLSVPMKSKGNVMGILCIMMNHCRHFTNEEVELLTGIANQVGIAIENARLYENERQALERLAVSERNYRGLFENANDAIWVHDLQGNITVANKACETQTGYGMSELIGINVKQFLPREGLALAMQMRQKLLINEPIDQPYEQKIIRKDASEATLKLTTSPVYQDGTVIGFQNISRDVTEEIRMRENLNFYLGEVTKAQEEERNRIAHELHDDTIQALVVLSRQLDNLASCEDLRAERKEALEDLWQDTNAIMQGVRRLSQGLRPPTLDRLGLLPAIQWLASDLSGYSTIPIETLMEGIEHRLPKDAELMLFRIAQEALHNVCRHSGATRAEVLVQFEPASVRITISDNGRGFELPSSVGDLTRLGKLGLVGMQERARLMGATTSISAAPGKGTTISVELPLRCSL